MCLSRDCHGLFPWLHPSRRFQKLRLLEGSPRADPFGIQFGCEDSPRGPRGFTKRIYASGRSALVLRGVSASFHVCNVFLVVLQRHLQKPCSLVGISWFLVRTKRLRRITPGESRWKLLFPNHRPLVGADSLRSERSSLALSCTPRHVAEGPSDVANLSPPLYRLVRGALFLSYDPPPWREVQSKSTF